MKSYIRTILNVAIGIVGIVVEAKREKISFTITCSKCECVGELGDFFSKESGDIAVVNGDGLDENRENIVSISCNECGNSIVSSGY